MRARRRYAVRPMPPGSILEAVQRSLLAVVDPAALNNVATHAAAQGAVIQHNVARAENFTSRNSTRVVSSSRG